MASRDVGIAVATMGSKSTRHQGGGATSLALLSSERRRSQRARAVLSAHFRMGNRHFEAQTLNVSSHGVALDTDDRLPEGTPVSLFLDLGQSGNVSAWGRVARQSGDGLVVEMEHMVPRHRETLTGYLYRQFGLEPPSSVPSNPHSTDGPDATVAKSNGLIAEASVEVASQRRLPASSTWLTAVYRTLYLLLPIVALLIAIRLAIAFLDSLPTQL